ncbi:hypothetical protein OAory_01114310 [Aspergillus oryzae]|uniref:Uncharacterized protein n=1 Tax=Aspergillus oryzae TaxID=5062 RepID=A0A1S9D8I0_ASPOZ|nr:hypothetical protein OAory_01114310 [Aspergillus oryzae]
MDHPRKSAQPAASTNRVPTVRSNPVIKRSVSSATAGIHNQTGSGPTDQPQEPNKQALHYSLQMKNALTELLNDVRAKGSDQGSRCLQNILMENERELTASDLAKLARVSHELNDLATPYLYQTVHFHSPGRIKPDDQLLSQLDILGNLHFNKLVYTRRVVVSGSWYEAYAAIDSELGEHQILSPAARMFSNIIRNCIQRMPNLEEFMYYPSFPLSHWGCSMLGHASFTDTGLADDRIAATEAAVLANPYGYGLHPEAVLSPNLAPPHNSQAKGVALKHATQLERLSIWADDRAELSISSLVEDWHKPAPFRLRSLDIRGFSDIGIPAKSMWAAIPPTELRELTLELGPSLLVQDPTEFWDASDEADLRPLRLRVNLGIKGIQEFISSFSGLEAFHLVPSDTLRPMEPIRVLVDALRRHHSSTLKVLGLSPFLDGSKYVLDVPDIKYLVGALPDIEELRVSQASLNQEFMQIALLLPRLRVAQIDLVHEDPATESIFLDFIVYLLRKGYARNLTYVAFDDTTVREIRRNPIRLSDGVSRVGYVGGTVLLNEEVFDWVRTSF